MCWSAYLAWGAARLGEVQEGRVDDDDDDDEGVSEREKTAPLFFWQKEREAPSPWAHE